MSQTAQLSNRLESDRPRRFFCRLQVQFDIMYCNRRGNVGFIFLDPGLSILCLDTMVHPPETSILSPFGAGRNQASKKFLIFLAPQLKIQEGFGMRPFSSYETERIAWISMAISTSICWHLIGLEVWDGLEWFCGIAGMVDGVLSTLYGQCFYSDFAFCFTAHVFSWDDLTWGFP